MNFPNPKLSLLLPQLPYGFTNSKRQFLAYTTQTGHTEFLLLSSPKAHKHHHRHLSLELILSQFRIFLKCAMFFYTDLHIQEAKFCTHLLFQPNVKWNHYACWTFSRM